MCAYADSRPLFHNDTVTGRSGLEVIRAADPAPNYGRLEMAFVLTDLTEWSALVEGMRSGVGVAIIDRTDDGLAAMAGWAEQQLTAGNRNFDAIHLFSHGSPGQLHLGSLLLDAARVQDRKDDLRLLGAALADDGEVLMYGCNLAQGTGADLIRQIASRHQPARPLPELRSV